MGVEGVRPTRPGLDPHTSGVETQKFLGSTGHLPPAGPLLKEKRENEIEDKVETRTKLVPERERESRGEEKDSDVPLIQRRNTVLCKNTID